MNNKRLYLDYASATPLNASVERAMSKYLKKNFGNPSGLHQEGREAKKTLEESRTRVSRSLRAKPEDIIFTSGGTESNTLAILGHIESLRSKGLLYKDMHIITTLAEHITILLVCKKLESYGVSVTYLPLTTEGIISLSEYEKAFRKETVLVSIQYVNSEIGTIMPIRKCAQFAHSYAKKNAQKIAVHTDASQAPLFLSVQKDYLRVDLMTLDGQKMHGPRGSGIVFRNRMTPLTQVLFGGSQEFGLRPGTEPVALALGFSLALETAQNSWRENKEKTLLVQQYGFQILEKKIGGVIFNGSQKYRIANNIHISLPGYDTTYMTVLLDKEGIACSTRVSCEGRDGGVSKVVQMLHNNNAISESTLRFSFGPKITKKDMDRLHKALQKVITFLSKSPLSKTTK